MGSKLSEYSPPDPDSIRDILEECGWSQAYAAELLGVDSRTFRRWIDPEDTPMPYAAWTLFLYHANYDIGLPALIRGD